jgi:hypothetical protein
MGSNHRPLSYQDSVLPLNYTLKIIKNTIRNITEKLKLGKFILTPAPLQVLLERGASSGVRQNKKPP